MIRYQPGFPENPPPGALFLDRDGTLIVDVHHGHDPEGVQLLPGVAEALRAVRDLGWMLFLFTNQSGIGRGFFTLEDAVACNQRMVQEIGLGESLFQGVCIAPEHPNNPVHYRKPCPRFITESIRRYHLNPDHCWMVGDRPSDWLAGVNAGIHPVALSCGKMIDPEGQALIREHQIPTHPNLLTWVQTLLAP